MNKLQTNQNEIFKICKVISILMIVSLWIFKIINSNQIEPYVDEIFHIPQTIKYCEFKFKEWDNKITTLPGLYILALIYSNVLSMFGIGDKVWISHCSVGVLRSFNLFCLIITFISIYEILKISTYNVLSTMNKKNNQKTIIENQTSINYTIILRTIHLSIFPIFYFFHFLFYTDVVSTLSIFLTLLFSLKNRFNLSSIFGLISVTIRQTNIIWVFFITINNILKLYEDDKEKQKKTQELNLFKEIIDFIKFIFKNLLEIIRKFIGFILVGLLFLIFLYKNGSIVVGDKSNHESSFHVPQLFYFSLVTMIFSLPSILMSSLLKRFDGNQDRNHHQYYFDPIEFLKNINIKYLVVVMIGMILMIWKFTYTHLFLLSDNRHYTFYIWNRFMEKYSIGRYLPIPLYCYSIWFIWNVLSENRSKLWCIFYFLSTSIVLLPSPLVEPRYYIVPFFLFQLNQFHHYNNNFLKIENLKRINLLIYLDILYFIFINFITIFIFIKFPFIYPDGTIGRFFY
ncbi:hypothetical protein RB653_003222 [Dictyostelium firmibasis]|uniref:Dol-P-Glc:Glc(2)Man(9)GlcNAc(2)-PP-Dol alpha-1,2-glucosyltransferase n=1 Tax=Dictyostelium firmibasis TaxID=79012 RepID=A0AAN7TQ63_9MYCE